MKITGIENFNIKKKMHKRIGSMIGSRLKPKNSAKKSSSVMLEVGADSKRSNILGGSLKLNSGRSIMEQDNNDNVTELSPHESQRSGLSH